MIILVWLAEAETTCAILLAITSISSANFSHSLVSFFILLKQIRETLAAKAVRRRILESWQKKNILVRIKNKTWENIWNRENVFAYYNFLDYNYRYYWRQLEYHAKPFSDSFWNWDVLDWRSGKYWLICCHCSIVDLKVLLAAKMAVSRYAVTKLRCTEVN